MPDSSLIGRLPDPYAERMTAWHVGTASICADRSVPVIPGWMDAEMTVGVVMSDMSRGGRVEEREGRG
jgi:hypothetical protein